MNEEEINEIVYEYYGFTINEIDHNVGYWCTRFTEERTKRKELEHNWNELKRFLEEYFKGTTIEDIPKDDFYKKGMYRMNEYTLDKISELEEGGNND